MRGPACFTNCCPAPAPVVIHADTYAIGANDIGWQLEMFGPGGKAVSALPAGVSDLSFGIAGALAATAALKLRYPPASPNAVEVTLKGTATQRPLVGLNGYASEDAEAGAVMNAHDYFVIGSTVYVTFAVAATDTIFVRYVAMPGAADAPAGITGMMRYETVAVTAAAGIQIGHWPAAPVGTEDAVMLAPADDQYGYATDGGETTATQFSSSSGAVFLVSDYDSVAECLAAAVAYETELDWRESVEAYVPETGWLKADGFTEYRINLYSALYAYLEDADLLEESARDTHFVIAKIDRAGVHTTNLVLVKA